MNDVVINQLTDVIETGKRNQELDLEVQSMVLSCSAKLSAQYAKTLAQARL